jgi:hypothetical protein
MKKILVLLFVLYASIVNAAGITGFSCVGDIVDGATCTITGSGFSATAPTNASMKNFNGGATGGTVSEAGWSLPNNDMDPVYDATTRLGSSGKSIYCNRNEDLSQCELRKYSETRIGKFYLSYWMRHKLTYNGTRNYYQWKMFRAQNSDTITGNIYSSFYFDTWPDARTKAVSGSNQDYCWSAGHGTSYWNTTEQVFGSIAMPDGRSGRECFLIEDWTRIEIIGSESSSLTADGTQIIRFYSSASNTLRFFTNNDPRYPTNQSKYLNTNGTDGIITSGNHGGADDEWHYIHLGGVKTNDATNEILQEDWMDDVYYQTGTFAHFELCVGDRCEPQTPVAGEWSATQVKVTLNTAPFGNTDTVTLRYVDYVTSASGDIATYATPIALGGTPDTFSISVTCTNCSTSSENPQIKETGQTYSFTGFTVPFDYNNTVCTGCGSWDGTTCSGTVAGTLSIACSSTAKRHLMTR